MGCNLISRVRGGLRSLKLRSKRGAQTLALSAFALALTLMVHGYAYAQAVTVTPADGVDVVGTIAGIGTKMFAIIAAVLGVAVAALTIAIGWRYAKGLRKAPGV